MARLARRALALIAVLYVGVSLTGAAAQPGTPGAPAAAGSEAASSGGGWQTARATYYGAPASVARAYDPSRRAVEGGEGAR
jgi:hypothetical protein